ncbi:Branched-chain amino acid transport ATP-binding protein LivG [Desulfosporosinus sp. I2]|uniref:ABC transporter ATP-binding protein n=1 Tax=Desulfosporosinus sp. I2 TaxID=1617025 RepID=UPI0005EF4A27|nr:ABC transporter ATP-binding protein [Desulfosporosinus sp. I2]KJR49201.1 Branched-chain amino acid transport ATP-binding protein LivG [Desulfosporosinus sp. I2]
MLITEGVEKRFGGLTAVNNVSVNVKEGEIFGIIGPNGAGKTTFLNCISGFYEPEKGKVIFKGQNIVGLSPHQLCHKGMARTFQIVRSFPKMSALDNVKVAAVFGGKKHKNPEKQAEELMDFVGFPVAKNILTENLNTMQLKRLELARALATNCQLLLLDEVAAGLTPSEIPDFIALIKRIRDSGVTIITIEHVMKFIMGVCDRITVLQFGTQIAEGTVEEIKSNPKVTEAYLGEEHVG